MILCQNQPQFPVNAPSAHRRHPSAPPAVVVHPTRTPGLLSLSKPPRPSPQRQQQQQQQPQIRTSKSKHLPHPIRPAQAAPGQSSHIKDDAASKLVEHAEKKPIHPRMTVTSLLSPEKGSRGRQQAKPAKDKPLRSSISVSSSRRTARRNNNRQPSPPFQPNLQAEDTNTNSPKFHGHRDRKPASNLFDPFLVNSASDTDSGSDSAQPQFSPNPVTLRPAPTLSSPPSGKLARRRQPMPGTPTPTPSKAVPVPSGNRRHNHLNLSRSDSILSHLPVRPTIRRTVMTAPAATAQWDAFPICDDMTDAGGTPPATPARVAAAKAFYDGPRTAPLARTSIFPFGGFSTPSPSPQPRRRHHRTPSEGVFNMSFDEDSDSREEPKALFELRRRTPSAVRVSNKDKDKAGYFASSMFQNSPSPEELPPPSF